MRDAQQAVRASHDHARRLRLSSPPRHTLECIRARVLTRSASHEDCSGISLQQHVQTAEMKRTAKVPRARQQTQAHGQQRHAP
jgi:hypothetical protein